MNYILLRFPAHSIYNESNKTLVNVYLRLNYKVTLELQELAYLKALVE